MLSRSVMGAVERERRARLNGSIPFRWDEAGEAGPSTGSTVSRRGRFRVASLSVVTGIQVVDEVCSDVAADEMVIRQRWTAVRGTATLTLQASTHEPPNLRARLSLEDVVLEALSSEDEQRPLTLDEYVLEVRDISFRPG